MKQLAIECRTTIMAAVKAGDVTTAVKMLERIDRRLAPPRQTHGIEHSGGVTIPAREMSDEELLERRRRRRSPARLRAPLVPLLRRR